MIIRLLKRGVVPFVNYLGQRLFIARLAPQSQRPGNVYCTNASAVGRLCASISAVNVIPGRPGIPGIKMSIPEFPGMKKGVRECIPYL